ncbi:GATA zinc finger domain-containing protein 15-like [Oppia nitens]|uniref:GATA zinc finger domain-containing protein 15-like n=1 Tax=Oppia nitens TaxID=1686743 RepID=UPI0023DC3132|nr:GATA zinc finger domain-containing protein 15-like [Oppia nitens]
MGIYKTINGQLLAIVIIVLCIVHNRSISSSTGSNSSSSNSQQTNTIQPNHTNNNNHNLITDYSDTNGCNNITTVLNNNNNNKNTDLQTNTTTNNDNNKMDTNIGSQLAAANTTDCPPALISAVMSAKSVHVLFRECADNCNRLCRYKRYAIITSRRDISKRINGCRKSCSRNRCRLHSLQNMNAEQSAQLLTET